MKRYAIFSDEEWIETLTSTIVGPKQLEYFSAPTVSPHYHTFRESCTAGMAVRATLSGEFYELLSDDYWAVLRK